jgi:hypothetical protein
MSLAIVLSAFLVSIPPMPVRRDLQLITLNDHLAKKKRRR